MARSNYSYQKRAKELEKKKKKEAKKLRKLEKAADPEGETVETLASEAIETEGADSEIVASDSDQEPDSTPDEASIR